jgi:hypothetical protein
MRTILIFDDRSFPPRLRARHENIPDDWAPQKIRNHLGISERIALYVEDFQGGAEKAF